MGEQADLMIDGEVCEQCGCNFEEAHGYPVTCKDCWKQLSKRDKLQRQKAIHETL